MMIQNRLYQKREKLFGSRKAVQLIQFVSVFICCSSISFLFVFKHVSLFMRGSVAKTSKFSFEKASYRRHIQNSSCILVGCHSYGTVGADFFWNYYSKKGYSTTLISFQSVRYNNKAVNPTWCRIPAAMQEKVINPLANVVYIDIDTLSDVTVWCNMPHLGKNAPIVMTSLFRAKAERTNDFTVHGTQVQANLFVVTSGNDGLDALEKWENSFGGHALRDQGAIHLKEQGLCGIPGWIHCYRNPEQQKCHCSTQFGGNKTAKSECIQKIIPRRKTRL